MTDVKHEYLQFDKPVIKKIFITCPAPELELPSEECLELPIPIYGLDDSGDEWHRAQNDHVQIDLKMALPFINPSLYYHFEDELLIVINGSYVNDLLRLGTNE